MKTVVLYGSTRGSTRRIVSRFAQNVHFSYDVCDVAELADASLLIGYDLLLFFCPTYGDDEPQEDVESFLHDLSLDLSGRYYSVCAPGASEGYGWFDPGCSRYVREILERQGAREAVESVALDAVPRLDDEPFGRWCSAVDAWVRERCPTAKS